LLATIVAILSIGVGSLLPAEWFFSGEILELLFQDRYTRHSPPAACPIDPAEGSAAQAPGAYWNEQGRTEKLFVATGHFSNEARLGMRLLASIYDGTTARWEDIGGNPAGAINLYTANPQSLEKMGLSAGKATTLATWDEVLVRLEREPGALAILPLDRVGPVVRALSGPLHTDGRPAHELPIRTIAIAGDVMLGNWIQAIGRIKRAVSGEQNYPFSHISPLLRAADLAVSNLEFVASEGPRKGGIFSARFRAKEASLDLIREAGIDLVSLANNHTFDYGTEGFVDMLVNLEARGMRHVGAGTSLRQAYTPERFVISQARVAFLALTDIRPNRSPPRHSGHTVAGTYPRASGWQTGRGKPDGPRRGAPPARAASPWEKAIKEARMNSDIVFVLIHWGQEFVNKHNERQRRLAHRMVDLGANLVVGAHPHSVQGIEKYRGSIIIYSLGNLVFALNEIPGLVGAVSDGVLLECRLLGRRLYQLDITPTLEIMGAPIPIPSGCQDPILSAFRRRTMERIHKNSRF
jgi:hypothetical protein